MDFDRYRDSYQEELEEAIAFGGADAGFYTEAKATQLVDLASRALGDVSRVRALDAGCGPGETDSFLDGAFGELTGVDTSGEMIKAASERNPWASYRQVSAGEPLPFEDGAFDLSFAICVLHHVEPPDRAAFVAELARVTRPQGIVAVFEHNPANPATRKVVRDCVFDEGVQLLPMRETRSLLAGRGIRPVERRFILLFPWRGRVLRGIERGLSRVPIGAQYYVAGSPPPAAL
jgi:SAM-dependent methyltransferase